MNKNKILKLPASREINKNRKIIIYTLIELDKINYVLKHENHIEIIYNSGFLSRFCKITISKELEECICPNYWLLIPIYNKLLKHLEPYIAEVIEIKEDEEEPIIDKPIIDQCLQSARLEAAFKAMYPNRDWYFKENN